MNNIKPFLSVVSPAYNEELIIEDIVEKWLKYLEKEKIGAEIVICNDGSTDKTMHILEGLRSKHSNLVLCENIPNKGYGAALDNAIKHANGELIMTLDSDGQFDIAEYPALYKKMVSGNYDLVTGYRFHKKDSIVKVIADRCFNLIMRLGFGLKFKDTNCAQKIFKSSAIKRINIEGRGYPVPTEIMVKASELGLQIGEEKVNHFQREKGSSKLKIFKTSIGILKLLVYLKYKIYLYRKKIINSI